MHIQHQKNRIIHNVSPRIVLPVTIRDVSKRLNFSITTVSRALDGYPDVYEASQPRVIQFAHRANISPGESLAVAGFDGIQNSLYSQPPQITFEQPMCEMAHQLVRMFLTEISGETHMERHMTIQPVPLLHHSTIIGVSA